MKRGLEVNDIGSLESLAEQLVRRLKELGMKCATAESCTGGGVAAAITSVPGASGVFPGGIVSYTNEVKETVLGVSHETLESCGPVSMACATQMACCARLRLCSDFAVSVTGLAGPDGDGVNPVGCVWFGVSSPLRTWAEKIVFGGDRVAVRAAAVRHALELLLAETGHFPAK